MERSDHSRVLLIPMYIISNYALAYLNTCPLKQRLYGVAGITNQETMHYVYYFKLYVGVFKHMTAKTKQLWRGYNNRPGHHTHFTIGT